MYQSLTNFLAQADQFKQKVRGLVKYPTSLSSSPTPNHADNAVHASTSSSNISLDASHVVHKKRSESRGAKYRSSPQLTLQHQQELNFEELQMLKKIEEQNRLLEADKKSLKSTPSESDSVEALQLSRNQSVSSTFISSESGRSNEKDSTEYNHKIWSLWGKIVNDWSEFRKKNGKQLKEMIRCGIPHHFRGLVWQLLCDAHNSANRKVYAELIRQTSPSEKIIRRDIARTYPEQDFFKERIGQEVLFNVIKAYSLADREVGYCQGSAFIVGLLLMQMPEEEAFAVFVCLMRDYRLRELYKPSMAELGLCMYQLENLLQEHAPELITHFQAQAIHTSMFASSWFLTLFAKFFDLNLASRIMDVFLSEGMEIIFRIGLAVLLGSKDKLIDMDMEGTLKLIQDELTIYYNNEPNLLFQRAYSLVKYNPKKMKRLEKEYISMKEREHEEQIEMRRLRTENRLLRERIEALETENGTLADKLIEDRVNRALEAEEKIIMGKELSIAKRQAMLIKSAPSSFSSDNLPGDDDSYDDNTVTNCNKCEALFLHLQEELVQSKLREAETGSLNEELRDKLCEVLEKNKELNYQSKAVSLQEELIAAKLREAESNGAMKELSHKLNMLEENWQKHMSRASGTRRALLHGRSNHSTKAALQELQEELMSAKFRETKLLSQNADIRQKLMEIETVNHICTGQLRRSEEERSSVTARLRVSEDNQEVVKKQLDDANAKIADIESKNHKVLMTLRLRDSDNTDKIAELEEVILNLKVKIAENEQMHHTTLSPKTSCNLTSASILSSQENATHQQASIDLLKLQNAQTNIKDDDTNSDMSGVDTRLGSDSSTTEDLEPDTPSRQNFCGNSLIESINLMEDSNDVVSNSSPDHIEAEIFENTLNK